MNRRPFLIGLMSALYFTGAQTSRTTAEPARPRLTAPITRNEISNRWRP